MSDTIPNIAIIKEAQCNTEDIPYALQTHRTKNRNNLELMRRIKLHEDMGSIEMRRGAESLNFKLLSPDIEFCDVAAFLYDVSKIRSKNYESVIYINALENSKYYVGISHCSKNNIYKGYDKYKQATMSRLESHRDNGGGAWPTNWTWIHPVISTLAYMPGDREDENLVTLLVTKCFGEDNVRGGDWTTFHKRPEFPKMTVDEIKTAIIKNNK